MRDQRAGRKLAIELILLGDGVSISEIQNAAGFACETQTFKSEGLLTSLPSSSLAAQEESESTDTKSKLQWRKLRLLTNAVGKWKVSAADLLAKRRTDDRELQVARLSILDEIVRFLKAKEILVPRLRACITASATRRFDERDLLGVRCTQFDKQPRFVRRGLQLVDEIHRSGLCLRRLLRTG